MQRFGLAWFFTVALAACGDTGGGPDSCATLTMDECRAHPECASDECLECSCAPVFEGCRAASEPDLCPDLQCAQPFCCGVEADCSATAGPCAPPGSPTGCGVCNPDPGTCTIDDDCAPGTTGMVCDPIQCTCVGGKQCVAGCATTGCAVGETCNATSARCEAQACSETTPCPPNFDCVAPGPTAPHCSRRSCAANSDCDGWCVLGTCYEALGQCTPPVP